MVYVPKGLRPCLVCATWIPERRRLCDDCRRDQWEGYRDAGLGLAAFYGLEVAHRLEGWAPGELAEAFGR